MLLVGYGNDGPALHRLGIVQVVDVEAFVLYLFQREN
jgi:hypothetical protein